MRKTRVEQNSVFLNVPYDRAFKPLYLAYIVGLTELGLTPHAALAIPGGVNRLDRIFELIRSCRYSFHDLSRVELTRTAPATPRFNMPLELGLAIAWAKMNPQDHTWFVSESIRRRGQKSVSDLNGSDFYVHDASVEGVMRELRNAFSGRAERPSVPRMLLSYRTLIDGLPGILRDAGSQNVFIAATFVDLVAAANYIRDNPRS